MRDNLAPTAPHRHCQDGERCHCLDRLAAEQEARYTIIRRDRARWLGREDAEPTIMDTAAGMLLTALIVGACCLLAAALVVGAAIKWVVLR